MKSAGNVAMGKLRVGRAVLLSAALVVGTGCQKNLVLRASAVDLNRAQKVQWRCEPGKPECTQEGTVDEAAWNQSGTSFISVPTCPYGIGKILVTSVNHDPVVHAVCLDAPPSGNGCPGGGAKVPDLINGGLKCPDAPTNGGDDV